MQFVPIWQITKLRYPGCTVVCEKNSYCKLAELADGGSVSYCHLGKLFWIDDQGFHRYFLFTIVIFHLQAAQNCTVCRKLRKDCLLHYYNSCMHSTYAHIHTDDIYACDTFSDIALKSVCNI